MSIDSGKTPSDAPSDLTEFLSEDEIPAPEPEGLNFARSTRKLIRTAFFLALLGSVSFGIYETRREGSYLSNLAEKYLPDWKSKIGLLTADEDAKIEPSVSTIPEPLRESVPTIPVVTYPASQSQPQLVITSTVLPSSIRFETKKPENEKTP